MSDKIGKVNVAVDNPSIKVTVNNNAGNAGVNTQKIEKVSIGIDNQYNIAVASSDSPKAVAISYIGNPFNQELNTSNSVTFSGVTVSGNVIPSKDIIYDLGSPLLRFRDLYLSGNTMHLGDLKLTSGDNQTLSVPSLNVSSIQFGGNTFFGTGNLKFDNVTIISSNDAIKLRSANNIWSFNTSNTITFPNGTLQKTAWTGITTGLIDDDGNISKTVENITSLRFDLNSGFDVVGLGNGLASIKMNSTFKTWKVDGQSDLVAYGLDTMHFVAGPGIIIETNANTNPKSITFKTSANNFNQELNTTSNVIFNTISHSGLVMTSGTNIDQIYELYAILQITQDWQDTPIYSTTLPTGTYIVQIKANDNIVGGGHINEFYTGLMSWYSSDTNSTIFDEIVLHRAGQGPGSGALFLRVQRTETNNSKDLKLQIAGTINCTGASLYTFKFRRMI
jgi:hypothetical protein